MNRDKLLEIDLRKTRILKMSDNITASSLSSIQKEIVLSKDKNIIVDAGSGSGKTRVLTERVRNIIKSGVNPKSIVVITFTF